MATDTYTPPSRIDLLSGASTPRRLLLVVVAVLVALAGAAVIAIVFLGTPAADLPEIVGILLVSAAVSLTAGGVFLWLLNDRAGHRIAARLITAHVIGIMVLVINVAAAAAVLFDSVDDFQLLGLLLVYSIAIAAIYSAFVSGWFSASLGELAAASRRLAEGDLSVRVNASGEREFADLGLAMNMLAGRLQHAQYRQHVLEDAQRHLVSSVILEMQDPLGSLQKSLELIERRNVDDPESLRRLAISMQREIRSLHQIEENLEELARVESGQAASHPTPFEASTLVLQVCESLNAQAAARGLHLAPRVKFGVGPVVADPEQITRVLTALIVSAIRQEVADGSVIVEVIDLGVEVQVNVANSAAPRQSRDPRATHTLGLAIARRLVEINGGRIWVAQPITGGSVSSFTLPKLIA